jgi:hypothetical protein
MPFIEIKAAEREANDDPLVVRFLGEDFTCEDRQSIYPLVKVAGTEANNEMAVIGAFYEFLKSTFVMADWERFEAHCVAKRASYDDLVALVQGISEALTARPTNRPSGLPSGPPPTGVSSRVVSLSPAMPSRTA